MLLNSFNDLICYFAWILLEINKVLRKSVITRVIGQHSLVNFFSLNACIRLLTCLTMLSRFLLKYELISLTQDKVIYNSSQFFFALCI